MSAERFHIVDTNPNDITGGGGCLCSEDKVTDCNGPYAVFYVHDMASNISPHPVIGAHCLAKAAAALEGEVQAGGESATVIDLDPSQYQEIEPDPQPSNSVPDDGFTDPDDDDVPEV